MLVFRRSTFVAVLAILAGWVVASLAAAPAFAQSYPTRPITIVVVLTPGSGLDVVTRTYAERLSKVFDRPVVVENKPGGAQMVAINQVMAAPADGHTLVVVTSGAMSINPAMFKTLSYDPEKDFVPISLYLKSPFVLVTNRDLPVRTAAELIAYAKEHPGKLSYSSPSVGGAPHLAMAMMNQRFGLTMTHIPYKSTSQAILDIVAGNVQLAFAEAGASQGLIKDGKLRPLAVSSTTPFSTFPDVPTFAQAAGVPDFEAVSWHVLLARAGTPREIVVRLHEEMTRIMKTPEVRDRVANLGLIPIDPPSIEGAQAYMRAETVKWGDLVRKLGLAGTQ